jgi:hypothetical protein
VHEVVTERRDQAAAGTHTLAPDAGVVFRQMGGVRHEHQHLAIGQ